MNGKSGPVDLNENENGRVCLKEWYLSKWIPADFLAVVMMSFSNWFLHYDVIDSVILSQKFDFCVENSKISMLFSHIFTNTPTSNPCYYRCLERFKMIFRISKVFGLRDGATEILTIICVQKCLSENWTNVYTCTCCSYKLIINNA